ncbi:hypothetical protein RZO07_19030 [Pseudomonas protegens]|uniref:hypothetical protein n=1 Tax=Pseudomonas protegens TaxID=380021 RepID=UPI0029372F17|nr:hypothetical protein [Pseudomonas protegens]WOE77419.1 hypothetical protein RZO07_19030 [Pseudomonas protegens]
MHTQDTDTADWLGIPTPLETCRQHILLLENEFAELNLQLRAARENIFKLVNMQARTEKDRDEALARLREKAGEAVLLRKQTSDLELTVARNGRMWGELSQYCGIHDLVAALSMPGALINNVGDQPLQRPRSAPSRCPCTSASPPRPSSGSK